MSMPMAQIGGDRRQTNLRDSGQRSRDEGDFVVIENAEYTRRDFSSHDSINERLEAFEREAEVVIETLQEQKLSAHKISLISVN
jgi:hypothetical protein